MPACAEERLISSWGVSQAVWELSCKSDEYLTGVFGNKQGSRGLISKLKSQRSSRALTDDAAAVDVTS